MSFFTLLIFADPRNLIYRDAIIKTSIENKISIYQAAIEETVSFSFYRVAIETSIKIHAKKVLKVCFS